MMKKGEWVPYASSFAVGAILVGIGLAMASCSGGNKPIVGRAWRETHRSNGNVVSDLTLTITALGPPTTLTVSSTTGSSISSVPSGGTYNPPPNPQTNPPTPPTISVPAGTLTGTVVVQSDPPGFGGTKKLTFWDSFE